jgi:hypothetical protein
VANFRQHITIAGLVGAVYGVAANVYAGLHWLYAVMAVLLTTVGGILPDIDHPLGVQVRSLTTLLGTCAAMFVWRRIRAHGGEIAFEAQIWVVIFAYVSLRFGLKRSLGRLMVHRGIFHSLPMCAIFAAVAYLIYPSHNHVLRVWMAGAVTLGCLTHLILDEGFSVDLKGQRLKRSFGTAIKLWAPSLVSTILAYLVLFYLARIVLDVWPDRPLLQTLREPIPAPVLPEIPDDWKPPIDIDRLRQDAGSRLRNRPPPARIAGPGQTAGGNVPLRRAMANKLVPVESRRESANLFSKEKASRISSGPGRGGSRR